MSKARTLFITGASSGYGKATAQYFLDHGWNVVATMRKPDASLFKAAGGRLQVLPLDVTNADSINSAFVQATTTFGRLDAVVNNAGIGLLGAFEATSEALLREIFETNTFGVMSVCRAAIPHLRQQGGGALINVTSSTAIAPMPLVAVYAASKWAIEGFTESLSHELALFGIKTRIVEPGYAPSTNLGANGAERMQGLTPPPYDAFAQAYFAKLQNYPTAYSTEQDIAEAVFLAATDEGDQIRYPAGADTRMLAELRWSTSEEHYMAKVREMFGAGA
ncbi:SDR family oxidoreductase [Roseimicrobium sp. ORNL1]|uniref:SDR family oxidoreductase n=1 Tax=Roseimicrobium sp. ORNL1 TaxID=2711231 RepID=UPI0013E15057|nr:SDR family oxidoreductase [Roseimicrobium sp. ORNL1]QIF03524.1 SDR family oxidoreductase [Roseimicrobium sp. ORNL1]